MKESPILFKPEMVKAILDGRKTQTRRLIKPQPKDDGRKINVFTPGCLMMDGMEYQNISCPYGRKGDLLWVRETWADVNTPDGPAILYRSDGSYQHWRDFSKVFDKDYGAGPSMNYEAYPGDYCMWWEDLLNRVPEHRWKSPLYMKKWACRLWLELTADPEPQRLQDITEDDAIAEGSQIPCDQLPKSCQQACFTERTQFSRIWDSINGPGSWPANPFVWKLEFKVIEKGGNYGIHTRVEGA